MKPKHRRLLLLLTTLVLLGAAVLLTLQGLRQSVVYFYTPTELEKARPKPGTPLRVGGLVEAGSYVVTATGQHVFRITDKMHTVPVTYQGLLPSLFREGQGVVADGQLNANGTFIASRILAKHDEKYMPPEVAKALKKSGQWRD